MVRTVGTNESHALSPVDNRARVPDGAIGKCHLFHLIGRIRKVKIDGQLIFSSTNTQNEIILAGLHSDIIRRDIRSHADCIKIRPAILKVKDFVPTVSTPEEIRVTPWPPDQGVIARPAIQGVVAWAPNQEVITQASIQRVVAIPSEQLIIASKSLHEVVPSSTTKKIILIGAGNYK